MLLDLIGVTLRAARIRMSFAEWKPVLVSIGLSEDEVTAEATREEAGLDSLALMELSLVLRQRFGVVVTDEEMHEATTIAEVVELIDARRAG
ncbi:acyl carrier protein [Actinokineospora inagensis]|uniref:acyl carrier protein n=1 Tax=Actinokineospora inagensis TaxID=103730 RepID=UPI0004279D8D|nr:acyl carrier protein [Actinokineospora inagensis]